MPGISDLLDSDMESNTHYLDENSLISSVSEDTSGIAQTRAASAKKPRKRKCITLPKKPRAKAATPSEVKSTTRSTGAKRKADEDVKIKEDDEEDHLVDTVPTKPRGRTAKAARPKDTGHAAPKTKKGRGIKKSETQELPQEEEIAPSPVTARSNFASSRASASLPKPTAAGRARPTAKRPAKVAVKSVEEIVSDEEEDQEEATLQQLPPRKRPRIESRSRQEPTYRRRAGSASDTERGDPMLRRKLGDITRKYENMEMRHRNLKEVAVSEANANVEKLRSQCEAITEASTKLVTSLRKELAQQAPLAQESHKLKKQTESHEAEIKKLRKSNDDLSTTLTAAQDEIKLLQTKLASARATPAPVEVKPPTSNMKPILPAKTVPTTSNLTEKETALKLDLYGDLTGLIIRSVQQSADGDTYDCIQTGRNGTLHFKLFVDQENAKSVSSQEIEYLYTPMLNPDRDRELIEMMPDYLTEDITFVRDVAARFYARVVKTLTEKPIEEETE